MAAGRQPRGEQSPRAGARLQPEDLQPEDRSTHDRESRFTPIDQEQLTELESGGFDSEELAEARRAAESLAQRGKDLEVYNDFALAGFTGPSYEMFRSDAMKERGLRSP